MAAEIMSEESLQAKIREREIEIEELKTQLRLQSQRRNRGAEIVDIDPVRLDRVRPLWQDEYKRYGRQMVLPEVGIAGQLSLRNASILIVGLGGLGCPAASYLSGAGIGTIGLMDGDTVELSNLHRQILHRTDSIGMFKVDSAQRSLSQLNPLIKYKVYRQHLEPAAAVGVFSQYDLVLDCTDHPMSRYLVSDAAVCAGIPFISAAALRTDGQLYVLNSPPFRADGSGSYESGPCYRCVHPKPPPRETLVTCGEGGILGPVVGTMGVLMATEAIKLLISAKASPQSGNVSSQGGKEISSDEKSSESAYPIPVCAPATMLIYSAFANPPFRSIKLRGRRVSCCACSPDPGLRTIDAGRLSSRSVDYASFCGPALSTDILPPDLRITARQLEEMQKKQMGNPIFILDVRSQVEFGICSLPGSHHVPLNQVKDRVSELSRDIMKLHTDSVVVVCRYGNDSQTAVRLLQDGLNEHGSKIWIGDMKGGLVAWNKEVDPTFPEY